jgi:hypothetical protein
LAGAADQQVLQIENSLPSSPISPDGWRVWLSGVILKRMS